MNFTATHGFDAYARFTAKIRTSVKMHEDVKEQALKEKQASSNLKDPVDIIDISKNAKRLSQSL